MNRRQLFTRTIGALAAAVAAPIIAKMLKPVESVVWTEIWDRQTLVGRYGMFPFVTYTPRYLSGTVLLSRQTFEWLDEDGLVGRASEDET